MFSPDHQMILFSCRLHIASYSCLSLVNVPNKYGTSGTACGPPFCLWAFQVCQMLSITTWNLTDNLATVQQRLESYRFALYCLQTSQGTRRNGLNFCVDMPGLLQKHLGLTPGFEAAKHKDLGSCCFGILSVLHLSLVQMTSYLRHLRSFCTASLTVEQRYL